MTSRVPVLVDPARTGQGARGRVALVLGVVLSLVGSVLVAGSLTGFRFGPETGAPASRAAPIAPPSASAPAPAKIRTRAKGPITPVRVELPSVGADAPVIPVSLDADRRLQVPDPEKAGWWRQGAKPGAKGVAVVVAHVDSRTGPAVFYRLSQLKRGQTVVLSAADRSTVTYRIDSVKRYAKDAFPTQKVYGATRDAQLRLITCGGLYDASDGGYRDNVVVFASLINA